MARRVAPKVGNCDQQVMRVAGVNRDVLLCLGLSRCRDVSCADEVGHPPKREQISPFQLFDNQDAARRGGSSLATEKAKYRHGSVLLTVESASGAQTKRRGRG